MKKAMILLTSIVIALSAAACAMDDWDGYYFIRYEVTGTVTEVDVTMSDGDGDISQFNDVSLPWSTDFKAYCGTDKWSSLVVSISATNRTGNGSVTVTVYYKKHRDDEYEKLKSNTSEGAYISVTDTLTP